MVEHAILVSLNYLRAAVWALAGLFLLGVGALVYFISSSNQAWWVASLIALVGLVLIVYGGARVSEAESSAERLVDDAVTQLPDSPDDPAK